MTNRHCYLGESTFILGTLGKFILFSSFLLKCIEANGIAPDGNPHFAASYFGLYSLPMHHKYGRTSGLKEFRN